MSSVPPTNSVQTSEPTFTTISARVIEGLSVLDRLPARGSFLAQIIEIKEPNLIKLSVGIKELKARINGNVPPNIKPNMTIKFHTTAQKNNIKLFLPEPENLVVQQNRGRTLLTIIPQLKKEPNQISKTLKSKWGIGLRPLLYQTKIYRL